MDVVHPEDEGAIKGQAAVGTVVAVVSQPVVMAAQVVQPQTMMVGVPPNATPGSQMMVQTPAGAMMVTVPPGVPPRRRRGTGR